MDLSHEDEEFAERIAAEFCTHRLERPSDATAGSCYPCRARARELVAERR